MHAITDLRSDTVTRPTSPMLAAMLGAETGDDVLGDDPTVAALERKAAELVGKQAGLFVPSGTMANSVAIAVHTRPGDEVLLDWDAHSIRYEVGAPAVVSGVVLRQFRSTLGAPDPDDVLGAVQSPSLHSPGTALVVLENTHNVAGGAVIPLSVHRRIYEGCLERGVRVHIDGARLFNAAIASGLEPADFAGTADTVTFCLSKGLGCPVGSVLCGKADVIDRGRRVRKMLGGGLRQSGILAAAGIYALDHHIARLSDDHRRAKTIAGSLPGLDGVEVDMASVQTNMVYFTTKQSAAAWVEALAKRGVACLNLGQRRVRLVTHLDVDDDDVSRTTEALGSVSWELHRAGL